MLVKIKNIIEKANYYILNKSFFNKDVKKLTETTEALVFIYENHGFIYANPAFQHTTGYNNDDLINMHLLNLLHPDCYHFYYNCNLFNKAHRTTERFEIKIITKSGKYKWLDVTVTLVKSKGHIYFIGNGFNITRKKREEVALRISEENYRKLFDSYPDAVYIKDKGKIIFCNNEAAKLFGVTYANEIFGKTIWNYLDLHPDNEYVEKDMINEINNNNIWSCTNKKFIRKKDGAILNIEIVATKFNSNGNEFIIIISREISDRLKIAEFKKNAEESQKLLEEARKYDLIKTAFFANISHELRTPVNIILSTLQLIDLCNNEGMEICKDKLLKYNDIMKLNSYRLVKLINNLLDITKIDAGYIKPSFKLTEIVRLIEDTAESICIYAETKGVNLIFDTDIEEKYIYCDGEKVERILLNLLSNALKFTPKDGSINVFLADKGTSIEFSVKDTGIGIKDEYKEMIFERFTQVDKSLSRNNEGSGIGLSITKALVDMHHGTIKVNSTLGKGSEFIVNIPVDLKGESCAVENPTYEINHIESAKVEFSDIYL